MSFNGSGTYVRVMDWTTDKANAIAVTASRMDQEADDFATALTNTICRDGQSTTTARIPFAAGLSAMSGATTGVSYSHTNDTNTGMYFPAADQWGLVAGGTATLTSSATALTAAIALGAADGTVAAPGLSFSADLDCGMYRIGANNVGIAVNGAKVLDVGTAGLGVTGTLTATGAATLSSTLALTGNLDINTNKFNVTAASGNTAIAGTLAVTGAATLSSTISAAGVTSSNGLTVSGGAVDLPAGSVADADLAAPGAWKLLSTVTASASATVDIETTLDGTYDHYVIVISSLKVETDDVEIRARVKSGGSYASGASDYSWYNLISSHSGTDAGATDGADAQMVLTNQGATAKVGNASGEAFHCVFELDDPDATDTFHHFTWNGTYDRANALAVRVRGSGRFATLAAITGVQFFASSGNISSGKFRLYGIKGS